MAIILELTCSALSSGVRIFGLGERSLVFLFISMMINALNNYRAAKYPAVKALL